MIIDGKVVDFSSSLDALNLGIGMVHQEFSLLPDFTAAENILLNREPIKPSFLTELFGDRLDTIDRTKLESISGKAIERLGVPLDKNMPFQIF